MQHKKLLTLAAISAVSLTSLSAGVHYLNDSNHSSDTVLAESTTDGYSNVLNFTAKSKVSESSSTTIQHEPMDLIQIIDLSGSLSDGEFRSRNGFTGARRQQINDMIYVIQNKLTDEDHVMLAFYGTNNQTSYAAHGQDGSAITRLLTKQEALSILRTLNADSRIHEMSQSWVLIPQVVAPVLAAYSAVNTDQNVGFEDLYLSQTNRNKVVSVLQFTDDWTNQETIDTSFAEWAKTNARTFMTVVDSVLGENTISVSEMRSNGHSNIKVFKRLNDPNRQNEIAEQFESTATIVKKNTTTAKQKGHVTITPEADLTLASAELAKPDGSKINLSIADNRVEWTGDLDDGSYKLNYTFSGKPSVERSVRGIVSVDNQKVDEKVNTVKPEKISFETKYENDPSLVNGVEKEKQAGVEGLKYAIKRDNKVVSTNIEKQKQDRIILRGTKGSDREVTKQKIPFETNYVDDPDLEIGKTRVVTEGVEGEKEITKTYVTQSDKRVGEPTVSEKVTIEKIDKVIARGTKGLDTDVDTNDVPFNTIYKEDKNLEHGQQRVDVEGVIGKIKTTKTYITQSGFRVGEPTVINEMITTKVDKVIKVGTKPVVETKDLEFKTKYVENKELEAKKKLTKVEGKKGLETTTQTYSFNTETGEVKANEPTFETSASTDEVIEVGTKPVVTTKELEFKTERRENKNMKKGDEKVVREGSTGLETTTQTYSFNAETGEVTENEPKVEVKSAINKIIEYGTREEKKLPKTGGQRIVWLSVAGVGFVLIGLASLAYKLFKK